jgi:hypothetical protein
MAMTMATMANVAVHEAAHAVVGLRLGLPLSYATLADQSGAGAHVQFIGCPPIETRDDAFDWMTMCFAGHAAELALCPGIPLYRSHSIDAEIAESLAVIFSPPLIPIKFMIDAAQAAATKVVARDRTIIGRVAEALDQAGMLSAREITSIMANP